MRTKCGLGVSFGRPNATLKMGLDLHFRVVETTGLEPATFCLQSRDHTFGDLVFRASSQVSDSFISSI